METLIQDSGSTAKLMARGYTKIQRAHATKDNGRTISSTAKVTKPGKKVLTTKEIMLLARNKAEASIAGLMAPLTMETGSTTKLRDSAYIFGKMDESVMAIGLTTTCLAMAYTFTLMV